MAKVQRITVGDLKRAVPAELTFRKHTLTREISESGEHYFVSYKCPTFFDCPKHHHLIGCFFVPTIDPEQLPVALEILMRRLMSDLEFEVELETALGCSVLPCDPDPQSRTLPRPDDWNADDGNITRAHLERHLPTELPYRGHTLKKMRIEWSSTLHVTYECQAFFDCPQHSPKHNQIVGSMFFSRVPIERLLETLSSQLRTMYWMLECAVVDKTEQGCSLRPPGSASRRLNSER